MVMTCIHWLSLSLSFAESNDLLHDRGSHLAHHRPHPRKEIHERPHQPTRSWHDHDLCLILSAHDDREGTQSQEAMHTSWVQVFLSTASMIAVINSVLVGSFVGLLLAVFTLYF
jgi:hypothetical protein